MSTGLMRVKHLSKGYRELLTDPKLQADLESRARRIAAATGDPNIIAESSAPIYRRNRAAVIALMGDPDNKILHALDAGR